MFALFLAAQAAPIAVVPATSPDLIGLMCAQNGEWIRVVADSTLVRDIWHWVTSFTALIAVGALAQNFRRYLPDWMNPILEKVALNIVKGKK